MRGVTIARGVTAATFAAGPLFLIALGFAAWAIDGLSARDLGLNKPLSILQPAIASALFGAVPAFVPNLLGASALGELGRRNIRIRTPLCWLLVGAAMGALIGAGIGSTGAMVMATVGAGCALICRWGTRWYD